MADELSNQLPKFLTEILSKFETSVPKGPIWVIDFESFPAAIKRVNDFEPGKWDIEESFNVLKKHSHTSQGCLLAHGVRLPGEDIVVTPEGIQRGGFIRTTVSTGRDYNTTLNVEFLDTTVSIINNVMRPWIIVTSHLGFLARGGKDAYRTNATFYKIATEVKPKKSQTKRGGGSSNLSNFVVQRFSFKGICPVSIESQEYNYEGLGTQIMRDVRFTFHSYAYEGAINDKSKNSLSLN